MLGGVQEMRRSGITNLRNRVISGGNKFLHVVLGAGV